MLSEYSHAADPDVRRRAIVSALGVIVAAFAAAIVLFTLVDSGLALAGIDLEPETLRFNVVSAVVQYVGFIGVCLAYFQLQDDYDIVAIGWPTLRQVGLIVAGFFGLYALNFVVSVVVTVLDLETATNAVVAAGQDNPELFLYMIPITVFLVAPGEELLFRGIVQGWFRRVWGVVPGIAIASVLFGAIHIVALLGEGALIYVVVATLLGVVLGALYEYTENLLVPIAVHALWNAVLFGVQYLVAIDYLPAPA